MKASHILIILALFLIFSCNGKDEQIEDQIIEPCPQPYYIGDFFYQNSNRNQPPYQIETDSLIFSNSSGDEIAGAINIGPFISVISQLYALECPQEPGKIYAEYQYKTEIKSTQIDFPELGIDILLYNYTLPELPQSTPQSQINYDTLDNIEVSDLLEISLRTSTNGQAPAGFATIDLNFIENPELLNSTQITFLDSFKIHDKIFENVYFLANTPLETPMEQYHFYYSAEQGLIAFEKEDKTVSYKFERAL